MNRGHIKRASITRRRREINANQRATAHRTGVAYVRNHHKTMKQARRNLERNEAERAAKEINELRRKKLGDYMKRQDKIRAAEKKLAKFKRARKTRKLKADEIQEGEAERAARIQQLKEEAASHTVMTRGRMAEAVEAAKNTNMSARAAALNAAALKKIKAPRRTRAQIAENAKTKRLRKAAEAKFQEMSKLFIGLRKPGYEAKMRRKEIANAVKSSSSNHNNNNINVRVNRAAHSLRGIAVGNHRNNNDNNENDLDESPAWTEEKERRKHEKEK